MRTLVLLLVFAAITHAQDRVVLVVHGGAGLPSDLSPELEKLIRADVEEALRKGHDALKKGSSLDAVERAIMVLEDSPRFNAGRGAVFNRDGRNELNASIMEGKTRKAGAVAGISRLKNPIAAARLVMDKSEHVFMIGEGAERFAREQGMTLVSPLYFWTESAWKDLKNAEKQAVKDAGHHGTVGAVARDAAGTLAAGTSTGGITYVRPGRVGDSPIIGAGTYADNAACAVSCTGKGELFIRNTVASDIAARVKYKNEPLAKAAAEVLGALPQGAGGLIALDAQGNHTAPFTTKGMPRGSITQSGKITVALHPD